MPLLRTKLMDWFLSWGLGAVFRFHLCALAVHAATSPAFITSAFGMAVPLGLAAATETKAKGDGASKRITPNRSVPKVSAPANTIEFQANPTEQDIFRSHVLEEPLVPVGGLPSTEENAGLAAALLSYSKRTNPKDFSSLTGFLKRFPGTPMTKYTIWEHRS